MKEKLVKIQDSFNDKKSAADLYWSSAELQRFYRKFRSPMILPKSYFEDTNSIERVQKRYQLRGFQFGNWVTNEDRYDYLAAFYICLFDMQKVLKFKNNNIGLSGSLGVALGSRGVPQALAHYEPNNVVINISRYKREDVLKKEFEMIGKKPPTTIPKDVRFFNTGGIGSFAHEYGHFLDGEFGRFIEPVAKMPWLTGNSRSVSKSRIEYPAKFRMRNIVEDIFETLFWKNGKKTNFHLRLLETKSEYLNYRQEVFARLFEQYIFEKLQKIGIKNKFMTKPKYQRAYYLRPSEIKSVIPLIDQLIVEMRKHV